MLLHENGAQTLDNQQTKNELVSFVACDCTCYMIEHNLSICVTFVGFECDRHFSWFLVPIVRFIRRASSSLLFVLAFKDVISPIVILMVLRVCVCVFFGGNCVPRIIDSIPSTYLINCNCKCVYKSSTVHCIRNKITCKIPFRIKILTSEDLTLNWEN